MKSKLKVILFWGAVILIPGGALLLLYALRDSTLRKRVFLKLRGFFD